jgi:hypothetical protein
MHSCDRAIAVVLRRKKTPELPSMSIDGTKVSCAPAERAAHSIPGYGIWTNAGASTSPAAAALTSRTRRTIISTYCTRDMKPGKNTLSALVELPVPVRTAFRENGLSRSRVRSAFGGCDYCDVIQYSPFNSIQDRHGQRNWLSRREIWRWVLARPLFDL